MLVPAGGLCIWLLVMGSSAVRADEKLPSIDDNTDETNPVPRDELAAQGQDVFHIHCSACHAKDGSGVEGKGPDIREEGAAAADFVLRTGRMPMADPGHQAQRGPVLLSESDIDSLVAYVGAMGEGPAIPDVSIKRADVANGGKLFRLNCAACHIASGSGAIIGGGYRAPNLMEATPTQVGEAIIVGPGAMPVFSDLTAEEVNDIAGYIDDLQRQGTTDVESLGGIGPVAEGLTAWLIGMVILVGLDALDGLIAQGPASWQGGHVTHDDDLGDLSTSDRGADTEAPLTSGFHGSDRADMATPIALVVGISGSVLAITAWVADWPHMWFGLGLATAIGGLGVGMVTWSKSLPIDHEAVQQREPLCITDEELALLDEEFELTRETVTRRPVLVWLVGGTIGALLAGILTPLLELGSAPSGSRSRTSWTAGRRVVTSDGTADQGGRRSPGPTEHGLSRWSHRLRRLPGGSVAGVARTVEQGNRRSRCSGWLGGILEDLYPPGLLGGTLRDRHPTPGRGPSARLPLPPVGVRPDELGRGHWRAGSSGAATVAPRSGCRWLPDRHVRFPRNRRASHVG